MDEAIPTQMPQQQSTQKVPDGPIPGQSLTDTPGNSKWEKPAQYPDPRDAAEMVWKQMNKPDHTKRLVALMKMGTPIEALVRTTLMAGFSEGKWTVDTAMLIAKPVAAMMGAIAKVAKINVPVRMPGSENDPQLQKLAMLKAKKDMETPIDKKSKFMGLLSKPEVSNG